MDWLQLQNLVPGGQLQPIKNRHLFGSRFLLMLRTTHHLQRTGGNWPLSPAILSGAGDKYRFCRGQVQTCCAHSRK